MIKHTPFLCLLLLSIPFTGMAQTIYDCPDVGDWLSARIECTSGPFENPYLTTGVDSDIHGILSDFVKIGSTAVDTMGYGASVTYIYHVDTTLTHILLVRCLVNINSIGNSPPDSLAYTQIQILDSAGLPLGFVETGEADSNYMVNFTYHDGHGTTTSSNNSVNYSTPDRFYAFDLRHLDNRTLRIHVVAGKPQGANTRCLTRFQFACIRLDSLTTQYNCNGTFSHTAPNGFLYEWFHPDNPDSILGTSRTFAAHDLRRYSCRLRSYAASNPNCFIDTLVTRPLSLRETVGQASVTPFDTLEMDTVCRVLYRLESHFTSTVTTSGGDTTVFPDDSLVSHHWTIDGQRIHDTVTLVPLSPGSHSVVLSYNRTANCTAQISRTVFVNRVACHYYDSLYSTCPSVYDLGNDRVFCGYGTWRSYDSTELSGLMPTRHTLITTPGYDISTGNMLSTIPPGENASIRLGNSLSGSQFESITFLYKVDTLLSSLLILRYAAVLENPSHNPVEQPKFIFRILDSSGVDLDPLCYSAEFVANTNLGWQMASGGILWKDWTTVGVDLRPIHGQTISVRLSTHDCRQGAHFGYAYFTLGCASSEIVSDFCDHNYSFTAPDGFNYSWYRSVSPDTILAHSRDFSTTVPGRYTCRMDFIGAPTGSNCDNTIDIQTFDQRPVAAFSIDTVDTVGCSLRLRLINHSQVVTQYSPDSIAITPCTRHQFIVDTLPPVAGTDTLVITLPPGHHSLQLIANTSNGTCSDTLSRDLVVDHICLAFDTLSICPSLFPVTIEDSIIYGDTTLAFDHGDTLLFRTVVLSQQFDTTIHDTIVENQLPWHIFGLTVSDTTGIDTLLVINGVPPDCDTLLHYSLYVYPNKTDTAYLYLCPSSIPFSLGSVSISGDTVVVFPAQHGEDSLVAFYLFPLADSDTTIFDTILERDLPWLFLDSFFYANSFPSAADTLHAEFSLTNEAGCDSIIHYTLHIFWDGDHCDTTLTFPTLVTPNGDGINDRFVIGGLLENNCFKFNELLIYDRTGQLVWHAHNIASEADFWDPAAHRAPDATYFYVFKAHGVTIHTMRQGIIEVLR